MRRGPDQPRAPARGPGTNYNKLLSATVVSSLGDGLVLSAFPLAAVSVTADPLAVSAVLVAAFAPWPLISLFAGAYTDRYSRKTIMLVADAFRIVVFGGLSLAILVGFTNVPTLCVAAFFAGSASVFFDNAASTVVPRLVTNVHLDRANGRLFAAQLISRNLLGPPIGGLMFVWSSPSPFILNAASFGLSGFIVLSINRRLLSGDRSDAPLPRLVMEGIRYLRRSRMVLLLCGLLTAINLVAGIVEGILVLFVVDELGLPTEAYGVLLAVVAGGAIVGALAAPRVTAVIGVRWIIPGVFPLATAALLGLWLSRNLVSAAISLLVVGALVALWDVVTVTLRQRVVPDRLLGRVTSVYRMFASVAAPVGVVIGGAAASGFGLRAPFLVGAAVCGLMSIGLIASRGALRAAGLERSNVLPVEYEDLDHR